MATLQIGVNLVQKVNLYKVIIRILDEVYVLCALVLFIWFENDFSTATSEYWNKFIKQRI